MGTRRKKIVLAILAVFVVVAAIGKNKQGPQKDTIAPTASETTQIPLEKTLPSETTIAKSEPTEATEEETEPPEETEPAQTETGAEMEVKHIANKGTKKYHKIWCGFAPEPGSKNYWLTDANPDMLEKWGYTPCQKCIGNETTNDEPQAVASETIETLTNAPRKYNDGFVCFADKSTMVYHNPWCDDAPEFGTENCYSGHWTAQEIESEGYKPCAKCIW